MANNILILNNYYDEANDKWFIRFDIYLYTEKIRKAVEACEECVGTALKLYYTVPLNDIEYLIPEEYCIEVSDSFVADPRVKNIHKFVEDEFQKAGLDIKDFREHAYKLFGIDIFSTETNGKVYEEFKKLFTGYGR